MIAIVAFTENDVQDFWKTRHGGRNKGIKFHKLEWERFLCILEYLLKDRAAIDYTELCQIDRMCHTEQGEDILKKAGFYDVEHDCFASV